MSVVCTTPGHPSVFQSWHHALQERVVCSVRPVMLGSHAAPSDGCDLAHMGEDGGPGHGGRQAPSQAGTFTQQGGLFPTVRVTGEKWPDLFAAYSLGEWQPPWLLNEQVSGEGSPSHNLHPRPEESVCLRVVRSPSASSGGHLRVTHLGLLVLVLSRRALHGLVGALPFVHPQLRLLHDGSQLVQVLFDLFVVVDVLAGNKQLNLNNECNSSVAWRRHHHIHACMHAHTHVHTHAR